MAKIPLYSPYFYALREEGGRGWYLAKTGTFSLTNQTAEMMKFTSSDDARAKAKSCPVPLIVVRRLVVGPISPVP
jgi:hypothetical protein